jgi:hypothetical protein
MGHRIDFHFPSDEVIPVNKILTTIKTLLARFWGWLIPPPAVADDLPIPGIQAGDRFRCSVTHAAGGYGQMTCPACGSSQAYLAVEDGGAGGCPVCHSSWYATDAPDGDTWLLIMDADGIEECTQA